MLALRMPNQRVGSLLTQSVSADSPAAREKVARQFESLFAEQMIRQMRQASFGNALFSQQSDLYQGMYDHEIAQRLVQGKGLGLASLIQRSIGQSKPTETTSSKAPTALPYSARQAFALENYKRALPVRHADPESLPKRPGQESVQISAIRPVVNKAISPRHSATPEDFVEAIWPHAQRAANELGVSPKMLVAQAALETGWGRSVKLGDKQGNNLFGMKANAAWQGRQEQQNTTEFIGGVLQKTRASFRSYASLADCFADYVKLIQSSRYAEARRAGMDHAQFAKALQHAGYATDPDYANKLVAIADGTQLAKALKNVSAEPLSVNGDSPDSLLRHTPDFSTYAAR